MWDPILIKILLKKVLAGPVNSARDPPSKNAPLGNALPKRALKGKNNFWFSRKFRQLFRRDWDFFFFFFSIGNICFLCYRRKVGKDQGLFIILFIISYHLDYLSQSFSIFLWTVHGTHHLKTHHWKMRFPNGHLKAKIIPDFRESFATF